MSGRAGYLGPEDEALKAHAARRASLRVEKDDEGRPYQCGAFVADDSRWECRLESDHESDHEWMLRP